MTVKIDVGESIDCRSPIWAPHVQVSSHTTMSTDNDFRYALLAKDSELGACERAILTIADGLCLRQADSRLRRNTKW